MKKPTETDLVRQCLQLLRLYRVVCWRANCGGGLRNGRPIRGNPEGVSDVCGVLPRDGRFLACECKSPTGKVRPAQRAFLDAITVAGGLAVIVRDVAQLEAILIAEGVISQ